MWVPLKEKEKKMKMKAKGRRRTEDARQAERYLIFFLSQIYGNLTVGIRRAKNEKCSTRRGLRMGTKNTGFHREFR